MVEVEEGRLAGVAPVPSREPTKKNPAPMRFRRGLPPTNGIAHTYESSLQQKPMRTKHFVRRNRAPLHQRKYIDWEIVAKLCMLQCSTEEISSFLGVESHTLTERCKTEQGMSFKDFWVKHSKAGLVSLRRRQWVKAVEEGNPTMLIWLGKQYLGQTDKVVQEVTGKGGGPLELERRYHLVQELITNDELKERFIERWRQQVTADAGDETNGQGEGTDRSGPAEVVE